MTATYWTAKAEAGGYEYCHGNRQLDNGEWVNTRNVPLHRLCAVAWFGFDAVDGREVHHRLRIPWLNVESNLLPVPKQEHHIITAYENRNGHKDSIVESVTEGFGDE